MQNTISLQDVINATKARQAKGKDYYIGHCPHPHHEDKNPSFVFKQEGGQIKFKCLARDCSYSEIWQELRKKEKFTPPTHSHIKQKTVSNLRKDSNANCKASNLFHAIKSNSKPLEGTLAEDYLIHTRMINIHNLGLNLSNLKSNEYNGNHSLVSFSGHAFRQIMIKDNGEFLPEKKAVIEGGQYQPMLLLNDRLEGRVPNPVVISEGLESGLSAVELLGGKNHGIISIGSCKNINQANYALNKLFNPYHTNYSQIIFALDFDIAGIQAVEKIRNIIEFRPSTIQVLKPIHKNQDANDALQAFKLSQDPHKNAENFYQLISYDSFYKTYGGL